MAIKFNHVTNTISFTTGGCSASFIDSSATGIFETTGYARNCYVTTGQTGAFGGGGGGTALPNGTTEDSALCWNGSAWVAAQTYVATGQTGNFSAHDFDFNNFNIVYKCNSNLVTSSTGSAILEGSGNCVGSSLYSQINNGCRNFISGGCHGYIENGFCNCISGGNNIYSSILNGCCNRIVNGSCNVGILNGFCNCVSSGIVGVIVGACCSVICNGQAVSIVGGVANQNCFSSRSAILAGFNNFTCGSSTDAAMVGGNSNGMVGAVQSTIIAGVNNRICHASTFLQTGNVIINGFLSRIGGCFNTNYNTIINSYCGCICSGSCNTLINGTSSCLMTGALNSLIIGPSNVICNLNNAVIIGSGITANASNTLFTNNLCVLGSIAGTGVFETTGYARNCYVTTGQTGSFAYVRCPSSPAAGCVICYNGTNWVAGTPSAGGTTLPNGTSANSALCWNGSIWTTGQSYVATGQTGVYETTGYARNCFVTTGQTGAFGGTSLCSGVNTIYESFSLSNIVNTNLINFDVIPNSTLFYTGTSTSNFYLNLRGSSSCALNSLLPLNNSISVSFLYVNGATPYALTGVNTDGTAAPIIWAGGGGTPSGVANATNVYSITAFKTGNNSFRIFGSLGFFS